MENQSKMKMADPAAYETNKSLSQRDLETYLPQLIKLMNWSCPVDSILDYGCGAGSVAYKYLLPIAKEENAIITGVDISEEMIQYATNNFNDPRLQFFIGNIMCNKYTSQFQANSYDKIFSIYVLHFIQDHKRAFQSFYEILKPGGEIGFTVVSKRGFGFEAFKALVQDAKWSKYMKGIEEWIPEWFEAGNCAEFVVRNSLESAGFRVKYLKTNRRIYTGPVETAVNLFVSINPFVKRIPDYLMQEFKDFHWNLLVKLHKTDWDKIPVECDQDYEMIVCLAEKC